MRTKDGVDIKFIDRIAGKPRIVIYYPTNGCQTCIGQELEIINKLNVKFREEDIILIGNYSNIRNLYVFIKNNNIGFDVFSASIEGFIPNADKINTSIIFVVDENLKVKYSHVQEKSMPNVSKDYFRIMHNKYFNNKNEVSY